MIIPVAAQIPIYKVGIVLIQELSAPHILIIRPLPKHPGEIPKFVLPRGSRQYRDVAGVWHDARDAQTATQHVATLEPLTRTLAREAQEEAGLAPDHLNALQAQGAVRELGGRLFISSSKPAYQVHWFVTRMTNEDKAKLGVPVDASEARWATLAEIHQLAAAGDFSKGYLPVIEEAVNQ